MNQPMARHASERDRQPPTAAVARYRAVPYPAPATRCERRADGTLILRSDRQPASVAQNSFAAFAPHWAERRGSMPAFCERDAQGAWRSVTWAELWHQLQAVAAALLQLGLSQQRPLMLLSGNSIEQAVLLLAAEYVGVPTAPVSPAYSLQSSDYARLKGVRDLVPPAAVFVQAAAPFARAMAALDCGNAPVIAVHGAAAGQRTWSDLVATGLTPARRAAIAAAHAAIRPQDTVRFLFTSGLSGVPKGVATSYGNIKALMGFLADTYGSLIEPQPVFLDWLPWHHAFGNLINFGRTVLMGGAFSIDDGRPRPACSSARCATCARSRPPSSTACPPCGRCWRPSSSATRCSRAACSRERSTSAMAAPACPGTCGSASSAWPRRSSGSASRSAPVSPRPRRREGARTAPGPRTTSATSACRCQAPRSSWCRSTAATGAARCACAAPAPQVALIKAVIAMHRDETGRMVDLVTPLAEAPLGEAFLEHVRTVLMVLGLSNLGRHSEARAYFHSAAASSTRASTDEMALVAATTLAASALAEGDVAAAARLGSETLARAEAMHGRRSVSACAGAALLADAFYEADRIDDAREALANRLDMLQFSSQGAMTWAAVCYGKLQLLQETPVAALAFLTKEEARFRGRGLDRATTHVLAEQVRITLAMGDRRRAAELQPSLDELALRYRAADGIRAKIPAIAALSRSRLALAKHDPGQALQYLQHVGRYCAKFRRGRLQVTADLLGVFALDQLHRRKEAASLLATALASSYRLGLVRSLVGQGRPLSAVLPLYEPDGDGPPADYLQRISAAIGGASPRQRTNPPTGSAEQSLADLGLTQREREILALLERSMSNKRIALALNLSLETVKWNLKNIFGKLGVTNRYDAIVVARTHSLGKAGRAD